MKRSSDKDFIVGLAKGLSVIEQFDDEHETLTIAEVASLSGLSRAAARRCLHTLVVLGYARADGRHFALAPRVLKLGHAYLSSTALPQLLQPFLEELSETLHESCSASVLDGDEIVYIARTATRRTMSAGVTIGSRLPAYCSSMGRVLLAGLERPAALRILEKTKRQKLTPFTRTALREIVGAVDRARKAGFAIVEQELEVGLVSIAVPVLNARGETRAALNVGAPPKLISAARLESDVLPQLLKVQDRLRSLVP